MQSTSDKYSLFLFWFLSNGGLYSPSLTYPTFFSPGNYPGISANTPIPRNKVILAIPFSLIITVEKVKAQLKDLCEEVYQKQDDEMEDLQFLVLTLYLTYERQKGKESFYYPYLNLIQNPTNMCDWSSSQAAECQDPYLLGSLNEEKEQIPMLFDIYRKYVLKYSQLFTAQVTMKQFLWSLNFVQTRCYGWGLPETLLSPFADLFNHNSDETIGHYMFKGDYERKGAKHPKEYIVKAQCLNIEIMGVESREAKKYQPNERVKRMKGYFEGVDEDELVEEEGRYWEMYLEKELVKNPMTTQILESSDSQDNDSQQSQQQSQQSQSFQFKISLLRLAQSPPPPFLSLSLLPYKSPSLPINQQFQQHTDFSWYSPHDKDTYFIISTSKLTNKNQQLFNSYGARNNRFLLTWYGFALQKNKYNSIGFRVLLEVREGKGLEVYERYVSGEELENGMRVGGEKKKVEVAEYLTDQFKLKESRLCDKLIMYIRFRQLKRTNDKIIKVTFPTSLKHQLTILKIYQSVIDHLRKVYKTNTLSDDLKLLKQKSQQLKERHLFAVIHRVSNKRILEIQWSLVRMAQRVIEDLIDGKGVEEALGRGREEERDELLGNQVGRAFYVKRLLGYIRPLSYLVGNK